MLKRVLRGFRQYVKKIFQSKFDKKYFHWRTSKKVHKEMTKFCTEYLDFSQEFYEEHKLVFFCLIFNAKFNLDVKLKENLKARQQEIRSYGFDPSNPNIKLINDVLGNKPVENSVR